MDEKFCFVEPKEVDLEKAKYLSMHYRYLIFAPKETWKMIEKVMTTLYSDGKSVQPRNCLGGVWYYNGGVKYVENWQQLQALGMLKD